MGSTPTALLPSLHGKLEGKIFLWWCLIMWSLSFWSVIHMLQGISLAYGCTLLLRVCVRLKWCAFICALYASIVSLWSIAPIKTLCFGAARTLNWKWKGFNPCNSKLTHSGTFPLLPGCKIHSSFTPHPESRMGNDANTNQQVAKLKLKLIITNFLLPFSNQSNWFSSLQHLSVQHMTIGYSCLFAKNSESGLWDSSF